MNLVSANTFLFLSQSTVNSLVIYLCISCLLLCRHLYTFYNPLFVGKIFGMSNTCDPEVYNEVKQIVLYERIFITIKLSRYVSQF